MIVKQKKLGFLGLLTEMKGSIVPAITPHIISSAILGVLVCLLLNTEYVDQTTADALRISFGPFTALGVAISLFLGFHNNASYSRWWEARILWGRQIIVTRDIARFLLATMGDDQDQDQNQDNRGHSHGHDNHSQELKIDSHSTNPTESHENEWVGVIQFEEGEENKDTEANVETNYTSLTEFTVDGHRKEVIHGWKENIVRLTCAHTHAFRHQMRPSCEMDGRNTALRDRNRFLTKNEQRQLLHCRNPANSVLFMTSKILGSAHKAKLIDTYSMIHTQKSIDTLCEIQTACERIQNTTLPLAYSLLVHRTSFLYVLLVPFAIVESVGWWTPVFTAIVSYTFFGLDQLAKEIQDPFNDRPMCLALSAMSRTIEIDTLEALGKDTPGFLKPKFTILM